jgi:hypothetical protein
MPSAFSKIMVGREAASATARPHCRHDPKRTRLIEEFHLVVETANETIESKEPLRRLTVASSVTTSPTSPPRRITLRRHGE